MVVYDTSDNLNIIIKLLDNNKIKKNTLYIDQNFGLSQRTNSSENNRRRRETQLIGL